MDIRKKANAAFARAREAGRVIFERADTKPEDRVTARREKELQLRELAAKQLARGDQDKKEALAEAAREHARPEFKPGHASSVLSKAAIEKVAATIVAQKCQAERAVIEAKSLKQLNEDARGRDDTDKSPPPSGGAGAAPPGKGDGKDEGGNDDSGGGGHAGTHKDKPNVTTNEAGDDATAAKDDASASDGETAATAPTENLDGMTAEREARINETRKARLEQDRLYGDEGRTLSDS